MQINLSIPPAQSGEASRQTDTRPSRSVAESQRAGLNASPDETEARQSDAAAKDGDDGEPRKSSVGPDTGQIVDLSV
jgi:hypothetical protein